MTGSGSGFLKIVKDPDPGGPKLKDPEHWFPFHVVLYIYRV
jgi:hypothetical protein